MPERLSRRFQPGEPWCVGDDVCIEVTRFYRFGSGDGSRPRESAFEVRVELNGKEVFRETFGDRVAVARVVGQISRAAIRWTEGVLLDWRE